MQKMVKACNFYVSEWHLFAALLPYVRDELRKNRKMIVISQDKLEKGLKELVDRLNLKFEKGKTLDDISWLGEEFELEIKTEETPVTIIVQGTYEFITEINHYIEQNIVQNYGDIIIINCYEVYNTSTMLYNILDEHDYVFNTAGLNEKSDIFPGYIDKKRSIEEVTQSMCG